jgi:predicted transcriptional regulator
MKLIKASFALMMLIFASGCTQLIVTAMNKAELTKIAVNHDKLYLLGYFNSKSYAQVTRAINTHPKIKTIVLTANSRVRGLTK